MLSQCFMMEEAGLLVTPKQLNNAHPAHLVVKRRLLVTTSTCHAQLKNSMRKTVALMASLLPFDLLDQRPPIGAANTSCQVRPPALGPGFGTHEQFHDREKTFGRAVALSLPIPCRVGHVIAPLHSLTSSSPSSSTASLLLTCCQHILTQGLSDAIGIFLQLSPGKGWNPLHRQCIKALARRKCHGSIFWGREPVPATTELLAKAAPLQLSTFRDFCRLPLGSVPFLVSGDHENWPHFHKNTRQAPPRVRQLQCLSELVAYKVFFFFVQQLQGSTTGAWVTPLGTPKKKRATQMSPASTRRPFLNKKTFALR